MTTETTTTPDTEIDLNLVVICGRLATDPEVRTFDSGARFIRLLVTTRVNEPRPRTDVIPVTLYDPTDDLVEDILATERGARVWACGSVQRRFSESPDGRRSSLEIVAEQINIKEII